MVTVVIHLQPRCPLLYTLLILLLVQYNIVSTRLCHSTMKQSQTEQHDSALSV